MKTVNIYTDGACRGNPGPGGWGVLIEHGDVTKELFWRYATKYN
jgi:ribonuclease HI